MSDADQTILSSRGPAGLPGTPQQPQEPKRNPLVIIGGIGCALLLCAALLIGGGFYLAGDQMNDLLANVTGGEPTAVPETPTPEPTATFTPTPEVVETEPTPESTPTEADADETTAAAEDTPTATPAAPEIGEITFALGATEDYEPVDPATFFEEGVTEIHAIFDYNGLSPDYTWERVWYLEGDEVLRSAEAWSGAEAGIFDYFINAGGEPLSPGEWILELYIEGELLATGSFVIEGLPAEVAEAPDSGQETDDTSEQDTDVDEPTPTPTPTSTSVPIPTPRPAQTFKLAYTKWDGGQHNLYIGDTDGSAEQFILGRAAGPSWTPDGQYIFFYGEAGVDRQTIDGVDYVFDGVSNGIIRMNASPVPGNIGEVRLYQGLGWNDGTARWASVSPNGQMVAFDARPGGDYRIYFLGTDENQQYRFEIIGEQSDWSPDSEKVVYRSGRDGQTGIWISNRDDSGHTSITNANDSFPAWSPDGQTIAFAREEGGNVDIYTANVDGSNIQRLTDAPGPDTLPIYTPDGEIIFRSARTGGWSIWKMNGDGSNQEEIVPNAGVGPDWAFSKMDVLP